MKHKQSGVAIIEFALILPLLLILTFITTEFGRALYQYNILAKSVRNSARYMSTQSPGDTSKFATAKNLAVYGNPAGTGTPLAYGLSTSQVLDPVWQLQGTAPVINTVTVTIANYTFTPLIDSVFGLNLGPAGGIPFAPISATMRAAL